MSVAGTTAIYIGAVDPVDADPLYVRSVDANGERVWVSRDAGGEATAARWRRRRRVKAFAFFPLAIWSGTPPSGDVRISVRFYPQAGKIDRAAGIAFGIAPDGSYYGRRSNALENNMLYFRVVKGRRNVIDNIRNVPTRVAPGTPSRSSWSAAN